MAESAADETESPNEPSFLEEYFTFPTPSQHGVQFGPYVMTNMTSIVSNIDTPLSMSPNTTSTSGGDLNPSASSVIFPSNTANNYYSAIKLTKGSKAKPKEVTYKKKKTLATVIAEALSVVASPKSPSPKSPREKDIKTRPIVTSPKSPAEVTDDEDEPGHIPPVTSFQHNEIDAFSAASSLTAPTVKSSHKPSGVSPGSSVLSPITENSSVTSRKSIKSSMGSVLRKVTSPGSIKTEKASVTKNNEVVASPMSIKTEKASVTENKGAVASPMSIKTEKASATENREAVASPMSIKTEKAPVVNTLKSVSSKASASMSIKTENTIVDNEKVASGKSKAKRPAGALPKKPRPTKNSSKGARKSTLPPSLGIPELSKTDSLSFRAESPPTPLTSNLTTSRRLNSVRSMSPSIERYMLTSKPGSLPDKKEESNETTENAPLVDNVGSAVIITDLLNATNGVSSPSVAAPDDEARLSKIKASKEPETKIPSIDNATIPKGKAQVMGKETEAKEEPAEPKTATDKAIAAHETKAMEKRTKSAGNVRTKANIVSDTETTADDGQEVVMSPAMAKKMNEMVSTHKKTKTTLIQKARSFGSRSVSSKNSKQDIKQKSSKDFSHSSQNPASDGSTAASSTKSGSSGSIGSNENKSLDNISKAVTECTQKASNAAANKSAVTRSLSNCAPQQEQSSIKTVRSISPALSLRNKLLPTNRGAGKKEVELETIASVALKDQSLPREVVSCTLEDNDDKTVADNVSVEVVASVDNNVAEIKKSNSSDSEVKRKQKVKRLLKSRQKLRSNASSTSSQIDSVAGPHEVGKSNDRGILNHASAAASDNVSIQATPTQNKSAPITTAVASISESAKIESIPFPGSNGADDRKDDDIPALESIASEKVSTKAISIENPPTKASDTQGKSSLKHITTVAKSKSVSAEVKSMPPLTAAPVGSPKQDTSKMNIGEIDVHDDPNDQLSPPIRLIDCEHDAHADDELTLDPELCVNRQPTQIFYENKKYDNASSKLRFNCAPGFRGADMDESVYDDFVDLDDDTSYGGKSRRAPMACGCEDIAEEAALEMKFAASQVYQGIKKVSKSAASVIFGVCDITADGGVEVVAHEINAHSQLMSGGLQQKRIESNEEALNENLDANLTGYIPTIAAEQDLIREKKQEEDLMKKKSHMQKLKALSMKHL